LLETLQKLHENGRRISFLIAGTGNRPLTGAIESISASRVDILCDINGVATRIVMSPGSVVLIERTGP